MKATFTRTSAITVDVHDCEVVWSLPSSRQAGRATIRLPRSSAAFASPYLSMSGGSMVQLSDPAAGDWLGIIDVPRPDGHFIVVDAIDVATLANNLCVGTGRTFRACSAGVIAQAAVRDATLGPARVPLKPGRFTEGPPVVPEYEFTGQPLATVLGELMEFTGHEWTVQSDGAIDWTADSGRFLPTLLVEGGQLYSVEVETPKPAPVTEIVALGPSGREMRATDPAPSLGLWQRQELVNVGSDNPAVLQLFADRQLRLRAAATARYRATLRRDLAVTAETIPTGTGGWGMPWGNAWGGGATYTTTVPAVNLVREGDYVAVSAPSMDFTGRDFLARVLERTLSEANPYIELLLAEVPSFAGRSAWFMGEQPAVAPASATSRQSVAVQTAMLVKQAQAFGVPPNEAIVKKSRGVNYDPVHIRLLRSWAARSVVQQ